MASTIFALQLMPFDVCHLVEVLVLSFILLLFHIFGLKVVNSTVKRGKKKVLAVICREK